VVCWKKYFWVLDGEDEKMEKIAQFVRFNETCTMISYQNNVVSGDNIFQSGVSSFSRLVNHYFSGIHFYSLLSDFAGDIKYVVSALLLIEI
jgi:hypothetical protein